MKLSPMLFASAVALSAFLLPAHGAFADDSKHISDGAAKGQATEGMAHSKKGQTSHHHAAKHARLHSKSGTDKGHPDKDMSSYPMHSDNDHK